MRKKNEVGALVAELPLKAEVKGSIPGPACASVILQN
jgi:hypothetical protein